MSVGQKQNLCALCRDELPAKGPLESSRTFLLLISAYTMLKGWARVVGHFEDPLEASNSSINGGPIKEDSVFTG